MLGAILALVVVLGSPTTMDPAHLVQELGSPRYASREKAGEDLVRLGRASLHWLKAARDSKDAEIRARSVALMVRIENALLLEASCFDFRGISLEEAIDSLNRRSGSHLALPADEPNLVGLDRVTADTSQPLPFWTALDLLCSTGRIHLLRDDPEAKGIGDDSFLLVKGPSIRPCPRSDRGPFRVQLKEIREMSAIDVRGQARDPRLPVIPPRHEIDDSGPTPRPNRDLSLELLVSAEPRLSIARNGPARLTEAVNDRGQPLLQASRPSGFQRTAGYSGMSPTSALRLKIDLVHPGGEDGKIRLLRGLIPIIVSMRRPEPLMIPLAESLGKTFRADGVSLTLIEHRTGSNQQPSTIQVAIKSLIPDGPQPVVEFGEPRPFRPDSTQQQLEVLDEKGRILPWFPSSTSYLGEETRLEMTLSRGTNGGRPTSLRYHELVRAEASVPFEFRDIPIP